MIDNARVQSEDKRRVVDAAVQRPTKATSPTTPRRATVRAIAQLADVSPASVSRALNDPAKVSRHTLSRIHAAMDRLNDDRPVASPAALKTIGYLSVDRTSGPRFSGYNTTIFAGLARVAIENGTEVLLVNPDRRRPGQSLGELCRERGIGGLIIRLDDQSMPVIDEVAASGLPAIVVAQPHDVAGVGWVCVDSHRASLDAVQYLISMGHRRIAFCKNIVPDHDHAERHRGYTEALELAGIERRPEYELTVPADVFGGITAINRLLALPEPPTAVYVADPGATMGVLRRLRETGVRVPDDFSVVGFDDEDTRFASSPVYTSVWQDAADLARVAGQAIVRLMAVGASAEVPRVRLPSYLEVNATTAPPSASKP
ncbi:MAG: LacI family DNA-binding transcriptional regulator [Planctomycetota bacterium]